MSAPLSAEEKAEYTRIIDNILSSADLETVTRKKVREGLETTTGKDLSEQKSAIKSLIEARFDAISGESPATSTPPNGGADVKLENGHSPSDGAGDLDADGEIEVSLPPAKKKVKRESSTEDADAKLAAQLQAQENRLAHARTTRGGANAKVTKKPKSKPAKKKSAKRVRDDDDSEANSDSDAPKGTKRKAGGGFQKPFNLSYPLAELCGEPQVVKKLWEHIKANDLQDPNDKRQIRCDEKMHAVFGQSKVNMFQMNKLLGSQLYPLDE